MIKKKLMISVLLVVQVFVAGLSVAASAQDKWTKAEFSKAFCQCFGISPLEDDVPLIDIIFEDLRGKESPDWQYLAAMGYALPGAVWDGKA